MPIIEKPDNTQDDYIEKDMCQIISRWGYIQWNNNNPVGITSDEFDDSVNIDYIENNMQSQIDSIAEFLIGRSDYKNLPVKMPLLDNKTFICRVISVFDTHDEYWTVDNEIDYFN